MRIRRLTVSVPDYGSWPYTHPLDTNRDLALHWAVYLEQYDDYETEPKLDELQQIRLTTLKSFKLPEIAVKLVNKYKGARVTVKNPYQSKSCL